VIIALAGVVGVLSALGAAYGRRRGRFALTSLSILVQLGMFVTLFILHDFAVGLAGAVGLMTFMVTYIVSDIRPRPRGGSSTGR